MKLILVDQVLIVVMYKIGVHLTLTWNLRVLNCVEYSDSSRHFRDNYGKFGIFLMPKSMEDYKWEAGTYFPKKEEFVEAIMVCTMVGS